MRCMQRFAGNEDKVVYMLGFRRLKENFQDRGSVNDDQWLFLSARMAAAGEGRGCTG